MVSDEQFRKDGVSEDLLDLRRSLNDAIKTGRHFCKDILRNRYVHCVSAFISNPCGYNKVFLLGENGEILEHNLELLGVKEIKACIRERLLQEAWALWQKL